MDSQNPPKSPPYINPQIQYSQVRPSFQNLLNNQMSSFSLENFDPFTTSQQTPFFSPENSSSYVFNTPSPHQSNETLHISSSPDEPR